MAWKEIVDYTVPSYTPSLTLNNFGTITKDDFIKIVATTANENTFSPINIYVNNNTTDTNYYTQAIWGSGSSVTSSRFNNPDFSYSILSEYGSTIGYLKIAENNRFNFFRNSTIQNNSSIEVSFAYCSSTFDLSSITSLTFQATNGNISAGSRIQIYKLEAKKVADIKVSSNTTQIDITGLDIQKGSEYLLVSDFVSIGSDLSIFYNNRTSQNTYWTQNIDANGTSYSAERFNRNIALYQNDNNTMGVAYTHIKLSNTGSFTFQSYQIYQSGTSSPNLVNWFCSNTEENVSSITKLSLTGRSNPISPNSRFQLYKLY